MHDVINKTDTPLRIDYQLPEKQWDGSKYIVTLRDSSIVIRPRDQKTICAIKRLGLISRPSLFRDHIQHIQVYTGDGLVLSVDSISDLGGQWLFKEKNTWYGREIKFLLTIDSEKLKK